MRKLTKAEQCAWRAASDTDVRQPYLGRKKSLSEKSCRRDTQFEEFEDYKECFDVVTYPAHSAREVQPRSRWLMFGDIALSSIACRARNGEVKVAATEFGDLLKSLNRRRLEFLLVDLDLALTMAGIAALADSGSEKRNRNVKHARHAYEAVQKWRHKVDANAAERHRLGRKLTQLQTILFTLGEPLYSPPLTG